MQRLGRPASRVVLDSAIIPSLFDEPVAMQGVEPPQDYILEFGIRRRLPFLPDIVLPDLGDRNHSDEDLAM